LLTKHTNKLIEKKLDVRGTAREMLA